MCASSMGQSAVRTDSAQAKAKLALVRGQISALTDRLGGELKQRDALNARLREADLRITAQRLRLESLRGARAQAERRRAELTAEQTRNQTALDAERAALAGQVRAAYMIGRQEGMKLLLNQSDPANAGRTVTYYAYFARARGVKIDQIRARVARVRELVDDTEQATAKLHAVQIETAEEMTDLQHAREERASALAAVTKRVSSGNQELGRLQLEERAEESLVADLARVLQDLPLDKRQGFAALRGRLPWPVRGKMTVRYRRPDANPRSSLKWSGVLIGTTRGAKVRAPYFGRVVYADWLQGLGLLLIIGHSGNFMTLYGHAEVLYKTVGDWVAPGDVIAALSDSSGPAPQLYFEIRDGRNTVDPKIWLKRTP